MGRQSEFTLLVFVSQSEIGFNQNFYIEFNLTLFSLDFSVNRRNLIELKLNYGKIKIFFRNVTKHH